MTEPTDQRADYIAGLRQLADVLEQHPQVPLPYNPSPEFALISIHFFASAENPRAAMAAAAQAFPCRLDKRGDSHYFDLVGRLHGLSIKLTAYRHDVCERVQIGEDTITEQVPDPSVEVPTVEVKRTVPRYEWQCGPLLASAGATDGGADRA